MADQIEIGYKDKIQTRFQKLSMKKRMQNIFINFYVYYMLKLYFYMSGNMKYIIEISFSLFFKLSV